MNINRILFCISVILLSGCAQMVAPTGGPKDVTPPKALEYSPDNKTLHFNAHKIRITFDEYIQLKDLNKQLIVSPPLKHIPQATIKGKTLELVINDTLKDNTTYTFNFGNAICDNNEGNVLSNFQYVVSTGDHLDSLSLAGHVQDAFTHEVVKSAYVMLYADLNDSAAFKTNPSYIGLTDDNGNYRIENLPAGTYRLIVLSHIQTDYLYHPYVEGIGFNSKPLNLQKNDTANLNVFVEEEPALKLHKANMVGEGKIMMVFNKPAAHLKITPLNLPAGENPYTYMHYSGTADTVFYWINMPGLDSLRFIVASGNKVIDTAFVHSFHNAVKNKKKPALVKLTMRCNAHDRSGGFDFHEPITFTFGAPVLTYNWNKIKLIQDKDTVKYSADTSKSPLIANINPAHTLISDSTYHLYMLPGAFTDIFGSTNDTINIKFTILNPTYFGTLKLAVKTKSQGHYLVQLLSNKNEVYREDKINGTKTIFYDALPPGIYKVRLIDDSNGNGKWDTGNFLKAIQPEDVYYYGQSIDIRSNWDLTQSWIVQ